MTRSLRIVYMGTPEFAVPTLSALLQSRHQVVGVVTNPDRPSGRGKRVQASPVKQRAIKAGVKVIQPERLRKDKEALGVLADWAPELIVVAAYGSILPKKVLALPSLGCLNVHASLLPKYRGAAPINWCIVRGEEVAGLTIMEMEAGLDTGPMLLKDSLHLSALTTAGQLHDLLAERGGPLLLRAIDGVLDGSVVPKPQNEDQATWAPMIQKEDGQISWSSSATDIANLIRGFNPWPGAFSWHHGDQGGAGEGAGRVKFHLAQPYDAAPPGPERSGVPGQVLVAQGDLLLVACGQGSVLRCLSLQAPGKRAMEARDFLNGWHGTVGDRFGDAPEGV